MKILAFGASNSLNSINKQLAFYTANLFQNADLKLIDLNDYECAIYSPERQKEGFPEVIHSLMNSIEESDIVIISFAEYNGGYTTAFKNLFDWCSTFKAKTFENVNFLLLSTSTGPRGGIGVLQSALERFPRHGAIILGSFVLPSFHQNFSNELGITNDELKNELMALVNTIKNTLELNSKIVE